MTESVDRLIDPLNIQIASDAQTRFPTQGMVVLAASQIWFTWEVEDVFRSFKQGNRAAMKEFDKKLEEQLSELVIKIRGTLTRNDMKKLETTMILDVHSKDMVERFIRDR